MKTITIRNHKNSPNPPKYPWNPRSWIVLLLVLLPRLLSAQQLNETQSAIDSLSAVPKSYVSTVKKKIDKLDQQLVKETKQSLDVFIKTEEKLKAKMAKVDSVAANNMFNKSIDSLKQLKSKLSGKAAKYTGALKGDYFSYFDTLSNSIGFMKEAGKYKDQVSDAFEKVEALKGRLNDVGNIKKYLQERKNELKSYAGKYTDWSKDLGKLNKEAYYYGQKINEYKELFKDKKKVEQKALEMLKKTKAFNNFMAQNSALASLFNMQANADPANLEGLQTRAQVEALIQERLAGATAEGRSQISQQMQAARDQMNELKDKFPGSDNAAEMPNFKPKDLKSKSFLQRLEFGGNIQFQKSNGVFPTTSDIAGQVAYKFHKKGSLGIGAAYKLGLGSGLDHLALNHEGVGFRSFIDWKLKGSFYINGGYEQNYLSRFDRIEQLQGLSNWQASGLIGISKKFKVSKKLKGSMMLLYDILYAQQEVGRSPVVFRVSYMR